ncbi:tRNA1(Val) (adenine(37)-N6)-methyltransferase [Vibrio sp. Of7-15]|uniref:tRNA1(Val) (adenine(37)-N6)-methyltransferase n=1 Tax=Vibrio sp. Of7-15 TaxID=2724879 RepID=UPI001EF20CA9|nr:tRNA1(Val) (adenine(37)-N6)-methyltransferase [Vibrio sp. Of7-15]MCG7497601.1 tRNA1(Val) (adenine(37)-N6)-methyltransferase [Vibrio sp. Of7-15]
MAKSFTFKQFHIDAHQCGMPVSTDGVLLGAWANIKKAQTILDIGSGTGLLSLICAQRNAHAQITAVEIEPSAAQAALQNFEQSRWAERLTLKHQNVSTLVTTPEKCAHFDAIICNPPYFNNGEQSHQDNRATARHTDSLTHQHLLEICQQLLNVKGTASFILPAVEGQLFIELSDSHGFVLTRLTEIKTTPTKPVSRLLIELSLEVHPNVQCDRNELMIHRAGQYSEEFTDLTKDFYLKM